MLRNTTYFKWPSIKLFFFLEKLEATTLVDKRNVLGPKQYFNET